MIWLILEARAEFKKKWFVFLVQMRARKFASEINWPLSLFRLLYLSTSTVQHLEISRVQSLEISRQTKQANITIFVNFCTSYILQQVLHAIWITILIIYFCTMHQNLFLDGLLIATKENGLIAKCNNYEGVTAQNDLGQIINRVCI